MSSNNTIQQLSVFLENRAGRLDAVLKELAEGNVNIVALSLADTSEYGMLRMIVSDPVKGRAVLTEAGITAMLTEVVALRVPHATGSLSKAMHLIVEGDVNIEYMYSFNYSLDGNSLMILRLNSDEMDNKAIIRNLTENGVRLLTQEEVNAL